MGAAQCTKRTGKVDRHPSWAINKTTFIRLLVVRLRRHADWSAHRSPAAALADLELKLNEGGFLRKMTEARPIPTRCSSRSSILTSGR
jgi:hypothetical protein